MCSSLTFMIVVVVVEVVVCFDKIKTDVSCSLNVPLGQYDQLSQNLPWNVPTRNVPTWNVPRNTNVLRNVLLKVPRKIHHIGLHFYSSLLPFFSIIYFIRTCCIIICSHSKTFFVSILFL